MRRAALASLFLLASCSSKASGNVAVVVDPDDQTFTKSPAPVTLQVDAIDLNGNDTALAKASLPAGSIDLGQVDQTSTGFLRVSALDANGATIAGGESLLVQFGALDGITLDVFVQRKGGVARFPSPLADARTQPIVRMLSARYVLVAGGDDPNLAAQSQVYDLATFTAATTPPKFPRAPKSIAAMGTIVLLIDDAGATYFDLSNSGTANATAPSGGSFADVAGGGSIVGSDGKVYVVGGTRTAGDPTARVLVMATDGTLSWANLSTPRKGAWATWVNGKGLVVGGGSAQGAGVEVLPAGATSSTALPFPSDATTGGGAVALDATHVLVAGGTGSETAVRSIDASCAASCAPVAWQATLPVPLVRAEAFAIDAANAVVLGDDKDGASHLIRVATMVANEVATKAARKSARGVALPTGSFGILGGDAAIESYLP